MKYRKIGLRMCVVSIIMITLCIPNQIQIAKAKETDPEVKVIDEHGVEWDTDTKLEVFPIDESSKNGIATINPGGSGEYKFQITNQSDFNITYDLTIWEGENKHNYPIEYKILDDEGRQLVNEDWVKLDSPLNYSAKLNSYSRDDLKLVWRFIDSGEDVEEDSYKICLKVIAKQVTETDDNPVTPPSPDNPDNPDNPNKPDDGNKDDDDNKKDDNNNSDNNGNNGNNSNNNNSNNNGSNNGNNSGSNSNGSQNGDSGNNSTSNNNKGDNINNGSDDSKENESSNNKQENNQNNNQNNLNIDNTSNKEAGSTINKKKVNTSDITTPVIYVALMILTFGLILLVKGRKENS